MQLFKKTLTFQKSVGWSLLFHLVRVRPSTNTKIVIIFDVCK